MERTVCKCRQRKKKPELFSEDMRVSMLRQRWELQEMAGTWVAMAGTWLAMAGTWRRTVCITLI